MQRTFVFTAALLAFSLLAACTTSKPFLEYLGISTIGGGSTLELSLSLQVPTSHGDIRGIYYAGVARGTLSGTLDGTTLTAVLEPKSDCTYAFTGTLTETSLAGTFEPLDCDGGESGSWDLTRS